MIKRVKITNHLGNVLDIDILNPYSTGLVLTNITGLNPPKATINTTELATTDGSVFNSARIGTRNIVFTFKLLESPNIETTRNMLYKAFPIKTNVKLEFYGDNREGLIVGYVESNEISIFSSMEASQISILCPNPYFQSLEATDTLFNGVTSEFIFPFGGEEFAPNTTRGELFEFGSITLNNFGNIYYTGDAPTGIDITINAHGTVQSKVRIANTISDEVMDIDVEKLKQITGSYIIPGDTITINTKRGEKSITLLRNGVRYNIINCLNKDTDWISLYRGDNTLFFVTIDPGHESEALFLNINISNRTLYEGL